MIFIIKRTKNFVSYINEFQKWCYKNGYLMNNSFEKIKDIKVNITEFINNSNNINPDVISKYLLRNYHKQFTNYLNNDSNLVKKYVSKNIEIPKYIFDFNVFMIELGILYNN